MKLYCIVVDQAGNVHAKGVIEGSTPEMMLQHVLNFQLCGMRHVVQEITDFYSTNELDALPLDEAIDKIIALHDEDDTIVEEIGLYEATDDIPSYLKKLRDVISGSVESAIEEVTETQTTIIIKIAN